MVSRITAAIAARYKAMQEKEKGFTLIELLVVVIIIGVLAAIAIPIYIGVQDSSKDSAVKSDLTNAKIAVIAYQTDNSDLPSALNDTSLPDYGLTDGEFTEGLKLVDNGDGTFCIEAQRESAGWFHVTSDGGVEELDCAGTAAP